MPNYNFLKFTLIKNLLDSDMVPNHEFDWMFRVRNGTALNQASISECSVEQEDDDDVDKYEIREFNQNMKP